MGGQGEGEQEGSLRDFWGFEGLAGAGVVAGGGASSPSVFQLPWVSGGGVAAPGRQNLKTFGLSVALLAGQV